jgi:hypothetical protein
MSGKWIMMGQVRKKKQKIPLDKLNCLGYNKDKESIPIGGQLPLWCYRNNCSSLVAGAVISFYDCYGIQRIITLCKKQERDRFESAQTM